MRSTLVLAFSRPYCRTISLDGYIMPAYVVASMAIHDPETYRKYTERTPPLVKRHGGRFLTRGDEVTTAEGEPFTDRMVILEFPSKQHVEAWLGDPDYVAAAEFRHAASTCRLLVQEGVSNPENPDPKVK
ncbi:DUF1330 domain-containing protein [Candidimonas sp. SYP-B2681]|nr:DUF1330 domain-containing protein [Candidimonas sp. SYP-B2681]